MILVKYRAHFVGLFLLLFLQFTQSSLIAQKSSKAHSLSWDEIQRRALIKNPELAMKLGQQYRSLEEIKYESKNLHAISKTYRFIKEISNTLARPAKQGNHPNHVWKNRNPAFVPFDENRSGREVSGFYYSGSDITTPVQNYMVVQAPKHDTVDDFFRLLLLRDSRVVVTLVMPEEMGISKCVNYWTSEKFPIKIDNWDIHWRGEFLLAKSSKLPLGYIVKRKFMAENRKTREKRDITQIHYSNWPDGHPPYFPLFLKLLDAVDSVAKSSNPITVHCSAGVGRSGTFVIAHSLRKEIRKAKRSKGFIRVNIPLHLLMMRIQRKGMVGKVKQYHMIYKTLAREA